ncbi:TlpA family protein disulfide reductase [Mariniflexile ostreae]|uniref:TlpA family protein disulfide reductase n=1 Tax=Mariniflexile ostreae TaxID=1520892 RepID=A0ABV5FCU2_9FLAO
MKKIIYIVAIAFVFISCKEEAPKDYVTLSGTIANQNSDSLIVAQQQIIKTIKVKPDGTFSDTLKVEAGTYVIFDGKEQTAVYLKNGYDLKVDIDTENFDKSLKYTGHGAEANNYLAKKALMLEALFDFDTLMGLEKTAFHERIEKAKNSLKSLLDSTEGLDASFIASQENETEMISNQLSMMYEESQKLVSLKGEASPKFVDYENYKGGSVSLDDLKGKYVYIDLWATWCAPCKVEIPFLKEVEKQFHGKNITFVSISVDRETAYDKWRTMVADMELPGLQLYAKEDQSFMEAFQVSGIPRFILIDPKGNVVDPDAPRPSSGEVLTGLFTQLGI